MHRSISTTITAFSLVCLMGLAACGPTVLSIATSSPAISPIHPVLSIATPCSPSLAKGGGFGGDAMGHAPNTLLGATP